MTIGSTISHYRIVEKLGEGGMGVVYKAEDTKLDRPVALKFLPAHLLGNEDVRKRFEREAKAAAALDHPNICTVHEIDEADGKTFLAMALVEGEPQAEPQLGVLMRTETGESAIEMRRADTGGLLNRMEMMAITDASEIGGLTDLDFDNEPEVGALGSHFGTQILEVRACEDGEGLRFYFME